MGSRENTSRVEGAEPRLTIISGDDTGRRFEIPTGERGESLEIGRSRDCDVRLRDALVSRHHCRISREDDKLTVRDLGSKNGTRVNGELIAEEVTLEDGDRLEVGSVQIQVQFPASGEDTRVSPSRTSPEQIEPPVREEQTGEVDPRLGTVFAGYVLKGIQHEGHRSCVYRVRPEDSNQNDELLALKLLRRDRKPDRMLQERFLRGGRAASHLKHPNMVRMVRAGRWKGEPYQAMELVDGPNLQLHMKGRSEPMEAEQAFIIARQILSALEYVYREGYVLRSVQPDNILVTDRLHAKLTDYDLLKKLPREPDHGITEMPDVSGAKDTRFAAPELISRPLMADQRCDVFGAGSILYYLLTLKPPFSSNDADLYPHRAFYRKLMPVRDINPRVPSEMATVVEKALSNYLDDRWQTPDEMLQELEDAL